MLIQTRAKAPGVPLEAVQFLGDPSVHPAIWWQPDEAVSRTSTLKAHWRMGGEDHGGRYGTSSSYLEIGDWIYRDARGDLRLLHAYEFDRDWQAVPSGAVEAPAVVLPAALEKAALEAIHALRQLGDTQHAEALARALTHTDPGAATTKCE